ncbi:MAG: nucleotide exchange factor GrpE [Candidatus Pacebacteria bacterium]|nr:nucleotide exchange factor GrpE [Candidatus Paceibacterota bacterium]
MNKKVKQQSVDNDSHNVSNDLDELIAKLNGELELAREKERRAVADYQNLVRRNREEKLKIAKFAALDFVETIIDPLTHLSLAAEQLNDQGLNMVISQLWMKLNEAGLEEINPIDLEFDVNTMEAVADPNVYANQDSQDNEADLVKKQQVVKVVTKGYKLNGEVIRHSKVIVS